MNDLSLFSIYSFQTKTKDKGFKAESIEFIFYLLIQPRPSKERGPRSDLDRVYHQRLYWHVWSWRVGLVSRSGHTSAVPWNPRRHCNSWDTRKPAVPGSMQILDLCNPCVIHGFSCGTEYLAVYMYSVVLGSILLVVVALDADAGLVREVGHLWSFRVHESSLLYTPPSKLNDLTWSTCRIIKKRPMRAWKLSGRELLAVQ